MAYTFTNQARFDNGINFNNKVGIFYESNATPNGQSANKGSLVLNDVPGKAEAWLKRDTGDTDWDILAERQQAPTDKGIFYWDDTNKKLLTDADFIYDTATKQLNAGFIKLDPSLADPSHIEAAIFWDSIQECPAFYNDRTAVKHQIGRELWKRCKNNTGGLLTDGTVVKVTGWDTNFPTMDIASNNIKIDAESIIGVLTENVISGESGEVTRFGDVNDIITTGETSGVPFYLGLNGAWTTTRPVPPNYEIRLGSIGKIGVAGSLQVDVVGFNSTDTDVNIEGALNGIATEKQNLNVVVSGGTAYIDVGNDKNPSNDLPFMIGGVRYLLNTTTGAGSGGKARAALTSGTINAPQVNFVYIYLAGGTTPTLATSTTFPFIDFVWMGIVTLLDITSTDTYGPLNFQRTNNSINNADGDGILNYVTVKLRQLGASYSSGINPTLTITTNGGSLDNLNYTTTSGTAFQLHVQTYAEQTGAEYYIINHPTEPFKRITDLNEIDVDAQGNTLRTNGVRYGLNVICAVASDGGVDRLYVNLPNGSYSSNSDCINDVDNLAITNVPTGSGLPTTAFRHSRICIRYNTTSSGTLINLLSPDDFQDERGFPLGTGGGGGASGTQTAHSDGAFTWFNSAAPNKIVNVDLSALTDPSTRTINMIDSDMGMWGYNAGELFTAAGGANNVATFNQAHVYLNEGAQDVDIIFYKNGSGQAYTYDAGLDIHQFGGDVTFDDSVVITGNLTVNGDFVKQNVETVEIQDNLLLINFGETGPGVTAGYAGNEIDRGTANPYRWGFNEVNDSFEVGEYFEKATGTLSGAFTLHEEVIQATTLARGYVFAQDGGSISLKGTTGTFNSSDIITGQTSTETVTSPTMSVTDSLQPIATREDTPTDTAIAFWDTATARFVTDSNLVWDGGTFTVTTAVSSEGVVCGKGYVGNPTTAANAVVLSHKNLKATASAYAIYQSNVGASHVNSASGQNFSFSIAGATRGSLMSNGDWQFRGTTNNNLLYTDYSEHRVGVNTDVPDALFDVAGISRAESFACENYIDIFEQTVPANPAADVGRLYVKDNSGTTTLYFRDNAGSETDLLSFAGATDVESATKSDSYTITDSDSARVFYLSGAAANKIFTLPTAADNTDKEFLFINLDSADELQIKGESTETLDFDGVQQNTIDIELKNKGIRVKCNGTSWDIIEVIGAEIYSMSGTLEMVYTKFLSGTSDADGTTNVAHGVPNWMNIFALNVALKQSGTFFRTIDCLFSNVAAGAFFITYDATNIAIDGVGSSMQSQPYRIKVEYYV